jgi:hypothetical protein
MAGEREGAVGQNRSQHGGKPLAGGLGKGPRVRMQVGRRWSAHPASARAVRELAGFCGSPRSAASFCGSGDSPHSAA